MKSMNNTTRVEKPLKPLRPEGYSLADQLARIRERLAVRGGVK